MIVVGGFLMVICGFGLAFLGQTGAGLVIGLLGLAAMLYGAHRTMR
jgi:hypothetical protein